MSLKPLFTRFLIRIEVYKPTKFGLQTRSLTELSTIASICELRSEVGPILYKVLTQFNKKITFFEKIRNLENHPEQRVRVCNLFRVLFWVVLTRKASFFLVWWILDGWSRYNFSIQFHGFSINPTKSHDTVRNDRKLIENWSKIDRKWWINIKNPDNRDFQKL